MKNVPTKISMLRSNSRLTQKELAERIGVSLPHYQKLEYGSRPLETTNALTVLKLAKVLNVDIEDLISIA